MLFEERLRVRECAVFILPPLSDTILRHSHLPASPGTIRVDP